MKKLATILALTGVLVAGCSSNDSEAKESKDVWAQVKEDKVLKVGTEGTYPPFTFHDKNGDLTGFDVEVAEEVAERLGVEVKFFETQWDAMFAGLDAKRYDVVANQVGINDERKEKYAFSSPYIASSAVIVTRADDNAVSGFEALKGKKTAQSMTSNYAELAKQNGAEVVGVEGLSQALELLKTKRVDATLNDKIAILSYMNEKKDTDIKIAAESEEKAESAFLFRQEGTDSLVVEVNKALDEMVEDGTFEQISVKWFGENVLK